MTATPRIVQSDGAPMYARTFSATTRHIPNPDRLQHTLCGSRISYRSEFTGDDGQLMQPPSSHILDLPPCERCERSAVKRWGNAEPMNMHQEFDAARGEALHMHGLAFEAALQIADPAGRALAATQAGIDFGKRVDEAWLEFLRKSDRENA